MRGQSWWCCSFNIPVLPRLEITIGWERCLEPVPEGPFPITGSTLPAFQIADLPLQRLLSCLQNPKLLLDQFPVAFSVTQLDTFESLELLDQILNGAVLLLQRLPENNEQHQQEWKSSCGDDDPEPFTHCSLGWLSCSPERKCGS